MAGYREHSFDPYAYEQPGRPMRPYNGVQWTGVALMVIGLAIDLVYFAERLGWMPVRLGSPTLAVAPIIVGVTLVNSRRQPGTLVGSEQLRRNRRMLLIVTMLVVAVLAAATVIELIRS